MTQSGITRRTPDPSGGRIVRSASGEATGLLVDRAQGLIAGGTDGSASGGDPEGGTRAALEQYAQLGYTSIHQLDGVVTAAKNRGFQLNVHAIGDKAVTRLLDAFERAGVTAADRFRVEHASMVAPADVPRFARLGVVASMQPVFIGEYSRWAADRVGPVRINSVLPIRTLLASGAVVACGTDYGASDSGDPIQTLSALVAGRSADGSAGAAWFIPQRVDVDAALRCMSEGPAFAAFQEHDLGALTVGRYADFTVLSADPHTTAPDQLRNLTVRMTVMAGRVRHDTAATRNTSQPGH
ncbi:MAG: amidohydrolase family protein [Acidobacteriota bacterium]